MDRTRRHLLVSWLLPHRTPSSSGRENSPAQLRSGEVHEQSRPLMGDDDEEKTGQSSIPGEPIRANVELWYCSRRRVTLALVATVIFVSMLLGAAAMAGISGLHHQNTSIPKQQHPAGHVMVQPCGSSPAEATARGCQFDVISFSWLPDACYDAELSEAFRQKYALEWFADPDKRRPLSYAEIMTGEHTGLYVNWEYHVAHCTAMWKKMHRALLGERGGKHAIDGYIGVYAHTEHCEKMLLGGRHYALDVINTRIAVKYPDCGIE
ncbi:hypothetical protein PG989_005848 [Apiospora arundinis]